MKPNVYIRSAEGQWVLIDPVKNPFKVEYSASFPYPRKRVVVAVLVGGLLVRRQLKKRRSR